MKSYLIMLLLLTVVLAASTVTAMDVISATPISSADLSVQFTQTPLETVGNLNPYQWVAGGLFGNESVAVIFNPSEQVTCGEGFRLTMVHMLLYFQPASVPWGFNAYAGLGTAVYDADTGCYIPGDVECISSVTTISIEGPGLKDIAIPVDCACASLFDPTGAPYVYYLFMHYASTLSAFVMTDGIQATCTSYNDEGSGWYDLEPYFGEYGNAIIYGDVERCTDPIGNEDRSWGEIKSLYR